MALVWHFYPCRMCCLDAALMQLAPKHHKHLRAATMVYVTSTPASCVALMLH